MKQESKKVAVAIMALVVVVACAPARATTMCMSSDNVAVILDPDINGNDYTYNASAGTWTVMFDYGNVSGISTCNTTSGSWGTAYPQYNFEQGTTGQYCWCKMLRPARSAWVYYADRSSASDCAADCAHSCAAYVRDYGGFRGGVFGSAGD